MLNLEKSRIRKQFKLCAIEGNKEIEMAMEAGMVFNSLYYVSGLADQDLIGKIVNKSPETALYEIRSDLYSKTAYRESSGGLIAIVETKAMDLNELQISKNPLILILEGIEKPGNLGAILRTADAAGLDAVICCGLPGDLYNPNTIRSSLGTVFTVPVFTAEFEEIRGWLKKNKIKTFCSNLSKALPYHLEDYTGPSAIVMGTEANGVTDEWIKFADRNIKIPMLGKIDSMNVSVASAILVFEAIRQRL